ncbi:MAG: biopolymer transporter ExbD [Xanthomonadales bacterium]|nr:biopolymer transporter ExbD [Xanthomonadales bacterium]
MAFTTGGGGGAMADINVTPLVDVMLVLLIIFLVTAPMLTREIEIDLPQQTNKPPPEEIVEPPQPIRLRIDADGSLFWDNSPMPKAALLPSLRVEASRDPQPLLEIEANQEVQYHVLTEVLSEAKNADMKKIGFVETL